MNSKKSYAIIGLITLVILNLGILEGAQILPGFDEKTKLTLKLEEDEVAIFGLGALMPMAQQLAAVLKQQGFSAAVINPACKISSALTGRS